MKRPAKDRGFTLMIIPHSAKSSRAISVPTGAVKLWATVISAVLVTVTALCTYFVISYINMKDDNYKMSDKTRDYEYIREQLDYYQSKTQVLEEKVTAIEELDKQIRTMLKDEPEMKESSDSAAAQRQASFALSSRSGVNRQDALDRLLALEHRIGSSEQSLTQLKEVLTQREKRLACTPTGFPVSGRITSRFGNRRSPFGRKTEFHDGLDIAANYGTPIKATADGKVTFVGYRSGYGYMVEIDHGYGFKTCYCHNSKNLVKVGQQVKRGQYIAKVGSSGRSTGAHVHYMVYQTGVLKNPIDFCQ